MSVEAEKVEWRSRLLARRSSMSPALLAAAAQKLAAHVMIQLGGASRIAAYVPVGAEPGSVDLLEALRARGTVVLLPVVRPNRELLWAEYRGPDSLVAGPWGLREPGTEPDGGSTDIRQRAGRRAALAGAPAERRAGPVANSRWLRQVDAILVPALAVDVQGTRLGRGAGYYDRALSYVPSQVPVVALLHDGELVAQLPADSWDRPVTVAVTPTDGWTNLPVMAHHSD